MSELNQPEIAQAGMMPAANDQMVVHGHAKGGGGFNDLLSHRDIRLRGCRVARGMVMHQDQSGRAESSARLITSRV